MTPIDAKEVLAYRATRAQQLSQMVYLEFVKSMPFKIEIAGVLLYITKLSKMSYEQGFKEGWDAAVIHIEKATK